MQTSIPKGFQQLTPTLGVGGRKGTLLKKTDGTMMVATFLAVAPRSTEYRLIFQAFEASVQLEHSRVIKPNSLIKTEGGLLLLSPWVDGPSIRDVIDARIKDARSLDLKTILRIARPVCAALTYGHRDALDVDGEPLHIPHGWIRPETLVITSAGQVSVRDYWIGWVLARLHGGIPSAYTSPQIARGEPPSSQGDIFAVGSVLFELATLSPLLKKDAPQIMGRQLVEAHYRRGFERLAPRDPGLSAIIRRCLAPVGAQRYKDMQSLLSDLLRLSRGEAPLIGEPPPPKTSSSLIEKAEAGIGPESLVTKKQDALSTAYERAATQLIQDKRPHLGPPIGTTAEDSYDVRATERMELPNPVGDFPDPSPGEGQAWNGASEVGQDVAQWFSDVSNEDDLLNAFNADWPMDPIEEGDLSELDSDLEVAVKPPRLKRFFIGLTLILAIGFGVSYFSDSLGSPVGFRISRMESKLGVVAQGSIEERLIFIEALAGRQRIGDNLSFRAEHLQTELPKVIWAASSQLAPMEAYFGLEDADSEPINIRLGRLEALTFGEPRVKKGGNERPSSLLARRMALEESLRGRIAQVEARLECEGKQPCPGGDWGVSLDEQVKKAQSGSYESFEQASKPIVVREVAPTSVESRLSP